MHLDPMAKERKRLTERRVREQTSAIEDIQETVQEYAAPVPDEPAIRPSRQPSMRLRLDAHLASHALRRQSSLAAIQTFAAEEPSAAASTDEDAEPPEPRLSPDPGASRWLSGRQTRAPSPDPDARRHWSTATVRQRARVESDELWANEKERLSPSASYYASHATKRYGDGSRMSRREAEEMEARLRALGWRGGGSSSKKGTEETMRAHVRGTLSRRDGGALRAYHGSFRRTRETRDR